MQATIDKAGRLVIPAEIRRLARLTAGTELTVVLEGGDVRLVRKGRGPKLERKGKRLVARPQAARDERPEIDVAKLVGEERDRWPW